MPFSRVAFRIFHAMPRQMIDIADVDAMFILLLPSFRYIRTPDVLYATLLMMPRHHAFTPHIS